MPLIGTQSWKAHQLLQEGGLHKDCQLCSTTTTLAQPMPLQLQKTALKLPNHLLLPIFASLPTVDGFRNAAVWKSVVRAGHAWSRKVCVVDTRVIALLQRTNKSVTVERVTSQ
jgi:hypothetical protein